jgi:DNA-binding HxlR family transcriptional regulator
MLTRNLRQLESTGLVSRRVMQSKAITVEYSLTQLGRTIVAPLAGMCRWAKRYNKCVNAEVHVRNTLTRNGRRRREAVRARETPGQESETE